MNQGTKPRSTSILAAAIGSGVLVVGLLAPSAQALAPHADPVPAPSAAASAKPSATPTATPTPTPSATASAAPTAPTKACANTSPKAPWRLVASRSAEDPRTVEIAWAAVACATRHNVSIFVGNTDDVRTVDAGTTKLTITDTDPSKVYRIQVSSRNDAGQGASTPVFRLFPATPAGVTGLKLVYDDVNAGILTWGAPKDRAPDAYRLVVTRVSDRKVVLETDLPGDATKAYIPDMDSRAMFLITLQPINKLGEGPKARLVVGDQRPNPVTEFSAIRDPGDPTQVIVTWKAPDNSLKGRVLGYEVAFGKGRAAESVIVKDNDASVRIPTDRSGVIIIRVLSENGKSTYSKPIRIWSDNNPGTTTTNQSIDLVEQNGVITIAASQSVASDHQLVVRIEPTADNGGFTETQYSQQGAQVLSFRQVPQGMYLVKVEGSGKELARRWVNVGRAGYMFAADWKTTLGSPSISETGIEMPKPGETRVLSLRPRATQDVVIETNAQLTAGDGYGFWFRTSNLEGRPSGLTFQYDPRWKGSFLIRLWQNGTECGNPIAITPFPAGLKINGEHRIVMSAKDDEMWATLNGVRLFSVPSLKEIIASNTCGYASPTGTQVGLRKWTSSTVIFKDISIN